MYIPPLKAFLSFGSFVIFKPIDATEASVGRLVHRDDTEKKIVVSLFEKLSAMVETETTVSRRLSLGCQMRLFKVSSRLFAHKH